MSQFHYIVFTICVGMCAHWLSHIRLCDPMASCPPGSSVCGIFPTRILGSGLLCLPPGVSSQSRSSTRFLHLLHCRWILYHWATGGALFRILQDLYPSLLFKCIVRIFRYATLKSISSVQSLSHVQLFATPWTTPGSPVHPNSWSLLKLM